MLIYFCIDFESCTMDRLLQHFLTTLLHLSCSRIYSIFMLVIKISLHLINMQPLPSEGLVQATEISSLDTIDISTTVFGQFSEYFVNRSSWRSKMPLSAVSSSLSGSEEIKNLVNFRGIMPILSACTVTETIIQLWNY